MYRHSDPNYTYTVVAEIRKQKPIEILIGRYRVIERWKEIERYKKCCASDFL